LQRHGFPDAKAARKWPGSVEDGISHLRSYTIHIHTRCRHLAEQARLYKYKTDNQTGDILTELEGKHDHGWDAIRYALEPKIFGLKDLGSVKIDLSSFGMRRK
jgi:phage terminase large subunit